MLSVLDDKVEALQILLDAGVSPESKDDTGRSLTRIAAPKDSLGCLELLHCRGATLHTIGEYSPIHAACQGGSERSVRFLLEKGIPADGETRDDDSPVHIAARRGAFGCLDVLRAAGEDFSKKNGEGKSALDLLKSLAKKEPSAARYLSKIRCAAPSASSNALHGGDEAQTNSGGDVKKTALLLAWAGSDIGRLARIIRTAELSEYTARELIKHPEFHSSTKPHDFDFQGLLDNKNSPGVGRLILETTPFDEFLLWANNSRGRLGLLASLAPLDYGSARRLMLHPAFHVEKDADSSRRFGQIELQSNPHAQGFVERFFQETPIAELLEWVGQSNQRLVLLSEHTAVPYSFWSSFIQRETSDIELIFACHSAWALDRFFTETPVRKLFSWANYNERRLIALLSRAPLDATTWNHLINDPAYAAPRPGIRVKYDPRKPMPLPPLIHHARENPHLPVAIRDAINASQS